MKRLMLYMFVFLIAFPLKAQERVEAQRLADQITIELTDGEVNLDKGKFLPILKQSKTISDLLDDVEDVQADVIAFPLPNMIKGEFEQALSLMTLDGPSRSQVMANFDIKKLSIYWDIFNYLDVPDLLKLVDTDLSQELFAEVKENPQAVPELLQGIPDQFKRTKASFAQLESLLSESTENKLISKLPTLNDHAQVVNSVAFDQSPKHNLFATGSRDGTVNIYTISAKNKISLLTTLEGHGEDVLSLAFDASLRHNLFATGLLDGTVNIYTISDKNEISLLTTLKGHGKAVLSVDFDVSHNLLATGEWDGTVNIYTISDKNEISLLTTLDDHGNAVNSVAFDPVHNLLATGAGGEVNIYTISDKNKISLLTTLKHTAGPVLSVAFNPVRNLLATGSRDGAVNLYSISDKSEISLLTTLKKDRPDGVFSVAFDLVHNFLATGAWDGAVNLYTISDKNEINLLTTLEDHTNYVFSVAFDPSHNLLATGSERVIIYDLSLLNVFANLTVGQALSVSYLLEVKPQTVDGAPEIIQDQINSNPSVRQWFDDYLKKEEAGALSMVFQAIKRIFGR